MGARDVSEPIGNEQRLENERVNACEPASEDETGTWEVEDDRLEGSFADEEEETFHLAETQLNEALASEKKCMKNNCTSESNHA